MTIKQTQTKLFDFADVGLDFCAGSKALFPDRFKRMLVEGYNNKTVASVLVSNNQVTFDYGVSHGYSADRVLKVNSGSLSLLNDGEFWIDSVTTNTLTITIDNVPSEISGGFTTKIAPLGWHLEYELANIHVYKMKHIDDTDRYVRLCFQNNLSHRNAIAICIGNSFDASTGFIDDENALQSTKNVMSPSTGSLPRWDFGYFPTAGYNNMTYSAGVGDFGKASMVGSLYHLALLSNTYYRPQFNAILPITTFDYDVLQYPLILCSAVASTTSSNGEYSSTLNPNAKGAAYVGNIRCRFDTSTTLLDNVMDSPRKPGASFLLSNIDQFNTTTTINVPIYCHNTSQFFGYCLGLYFAMYANNASAPNLTKEDLPNSMIDIDLKSKLIVHDGSGSGDKSTAVYVVLPVEEIKIA